MFAKASTYINLRLLCITNVNFGTKMEEIQTKIYV